MFCQGAQSLVLSATCGTAQIAAASATCSMQHVACSGSQLLNISKRCLAHLAGQLLKWQWQWQLAFNKANSECQFRVSPNSFDATKLAHYELRQSEAGAADAAGVGKV